MLFILAAVFSGIVLVQTPLAGAGASSVALHATERGLGKSAVLQSLLNICPGNVLLLPFSYHGVCSHWAIY